MGRAADQHRAQRVAVGVGVVGEDVAATGVSSAVATVSFWAAGASLTGPTLIETVATLLSAGRRWPCR